MLILQACLLLLWSSPLHALAGDYTGQTNVTLLQGRVSSERYTDSSRLSNYTTGPCPAVGSLRSSTEFAQLLALVREPNFSSDQIAALRGHIADYPGLL